ncbi:MAG TPA: N-acetylmuramoyl-L-alanine amidase [Terriglobales bacterium]|nr:N-acetylmuramoyl-L-alanine amidase [Terriglobales bacterium]
MRSNRSRFPFYLAATTALLTLSLGLILAQTTTSPSNQAGPSGTVVAPVAPSRPMVMIDPAHGGTESGAVLSPTLLEKDVTLALAHRLRQDLTARGVLVELVRDSDVNISTDDRAGKANAEHPVLYLCLHVSSELGGARIFSALLPDAQEAHGAFIDWDIAQSGSLPKTHIAEQGLVAAFQKVGLSAQLLQAPLRPLNNIVSPAVAVEFGPPTADVSQLMSNNFQQTASTVLANGIASILPAVEGRQDSIP